ncbi:unnamed protein product [Rangifer tarandus platyrhynchus]|uniref:Uncharacterized protein n=2 Tax=Rangifer tarandus platyrhynchus TaxID=3082113 RepID=A0ABN8ZCE1_RANTA|nr:unnamed protein product [Rangifer tarandus platyrhynchus]
MAPAPPASKDPQHSEALQRPDHALLMGPSPTVTEAQGLPSTRLLPGARQGLGSGEKLVKRREVAVMWAETPGDGDWRLKPAGSQHQAGPAIRHRAAGGPEGGASVKGRGAGVLRTAPQPACRAQETPAAEHAVTFTEGLSVRKPAEGWVTEATVRYAEHKHMALLPVRPEDATSYDENAARLIPSGSSELTDEGPSSPEGCSAPSDQVTAPPPPPHQNLQSLSCQYRSRK